jgi:hypothetical protein
MGFITRRTALAAACGLTIFTGLALAAPQVVSKYAALDNLSLEALDEQLQVRPNPRIAGSFSPLQRNEIDLLADMRRR